jgi:hypothetical protein
MTVVPMPAELVIQPVAPTHLHAVWETLRDDLLVCLEQDPDHPLPEDVYTLIKAGTWGLYYASVRGSYVGFIVLQLIPEWAGGTRCHVVYISGPGFFERGHDYVKQLARERGCARITCQASRPGFDKLTARLGYTPTARIYELRI